MILMGQGNSWREGDCQVPSRCSIHPGTTVLKKDGTRLVWENSKVGDLSST